MDTGVDPLAGLAPLAAQFKALGHPARLEILRLLAERGTCICGEVVEGLPLAQSTVSQHLKVLKDAGFVRGEVDGPRSCYCIDAAETARFRRAIDDLFARLMQSCRSKPSEEKT
jgi:ArsR family transcriptional regulator